MAKDYHSYAEYCDLLVGNPYHNSLVYSNLLILKQELLRIGQELFHQALQRFIERRIQRLIQRLIALRIC